MALTQKPYRTNVGALLFNAAGLVLVARRADLPNAEGAAGGWQLPQGGVDEGEDLRVAVLRELAEEVGTARAEILEEYPGWLTYDFPLDLAARGFRIAQRYRGQRQKWFALRFTGVDADIRLDADQHPEFDAWRWARLAELPGLAVAFKRDIYAELARAFAHLAARD
ncbi:RNA pyrophosphohydrolase [Roseomonas sp. AR75]|jgi:putative (di)nucleoside polyphosphate hydrolase|uniref:RNA pyrophosphohydrolase n=1 Tax=Roseomonas sp. AR75 TaxID=2562311 RepID=UPI0010C13534|nr:RNA pyrophosphohydrolase [Roseomonas sp. AR75]